MFWIGLTVGFCICVALLAILAAIAAGVEKSWIRTTILINKGEKHERV